MMIVTLTGLLLLPAPLHRDPDIAAPEILSSADPLPAVDEEAVLAFVSKPFDPMVDKRPWPRTVGKLRGVPVVVSYPCSDVCPDYTKRIVRYNVAAGAACARIGGISKDIVVPKGIGAGLRRYCIPAITEPWQK